MDILIYIFSQPTWLIELIVNVPLAALLVWALLTKRNIKEWHVFSGILVVSLCVAGLIAVAQYSLWAGNPATENLVHVPVAGNIEIDGVLAPMSPFAYEEGGYFALYAYTRFFLPLVIAFVFAEIVYGLCMIARRMRVLSERECFAIAGFVFVVQWPIGIAFLALLALSAVIWSLYNMILRKYVTTFTVPIIIAGIISVACLHFLSSAVRFLF